MTAFFRDLVVAQHELQTAAYEKDPRHLEDEERVEFIRWNVLALEDELHEMLNEVGWKPWATSRHVNEDLAMKELVDAFHFFMNLMLAVAPQHLSVEQLTTAFVDGYFRKRTVNAQRQEDGYDGVAGKCPSCHREKAAAQTITLGAGEMDVLECPCGYVWPEVKAGGRLA
jgi:dimeric dUTPase (all-alpha-NTP-PPase superfamily)